jgi:hypothetical protein
MSGLTKSNPAQAISPLFTLPFLSASLAFSLVYIWSRRNVTARLNILGLVKYVACSSHVEEDADDCVQYHRPLSALRPDVVLLLDVRRLGGVYRGRRECRISPA